MSAGSCGETFWSGGRGLQAVVEGAGRGGGRGLQVRHMALYLTVA